MAAEPVMATLQGNLATELLAAAGTFSRLGSGHSRGDGLDAAFARIREESPTQAGTEFRVIVQGAHRALEPSVRDEVYLIGHEALSNALRHARAKNIEVELEYAASYLRVLVRDDGDGVDLRVAQCAGHGCWGLWTMKVRAERIGARLRILSRPGAGTEVELLVPAQIAFGKSDSIAVRWFSRLYS
jgi:signal transduction histidine kinase